MTTKPFLNPRDPEAAWQRIAALEAQLSAMAGAVGRLSQRLEALEAKDAVQDPKVVYTPPAGSWSIRDAI